MNRIESNRIFSSFIEIKIERQLVDIEKENFKTELEESFKKIILPVHVPARLQDILKEKKKENFAMFDGATKEVHQESEYKRNEKSKLESVANKKIDEMMAKNEGMSFLAIPWFVCFILGRP